MDDFNRTEQKEDYILGLDLNRQKASTLYILLTQAVNFYEEVVDAMTREHEKMIEASPSDADRDEHYENLRNLKQSLDLHHSILSDTKKLLRETKQIFQELETEANTEKPLIIKPNEQELRNFKQGIQS